MGGANDARRLGTSAGAFGSLKASATCRPNNETESEMKFIVKPISLTQHTKPPHTLCIKCSEDPRWCGDPA
jgi:hypothetical protein